jgi:hypothetical protein
MFITGETGVGAVESVMSIVKQNLPSVIGLLLALVPAASDGCGNGGEAQENQITLVTVFSGTGSDSLIDVNKDGTNAILLRADGIVPALGNINFSEVIETAVKDPAVPCTTSEGVPGNIFDLVKGRVS